MTRKEAKELLPIIQAYAEGKTIQFLDGGKWLDVYETDFHESTYKYRIKPEPRYRPFRTQEECVREMMNHTPFGIITDGVRGFEIAIYPNEIYILGSLNEFYPRPFSRVLKEYKFADGTPFGIKEE